MWPSLCLCACWFSDYIEGTRALDLYFVSIRMCHIFLASPPPNGPFAFDVTHEFWRGNFKNGITSPSQLLHALEVNYHTIHFCCISRWSSVRDLYAAKPCEVANETRTVALFDFWGSNFR